MKPITQEWLDIATEDLDVGQSMLSGGRYLYAGFMAQQCAEKALKAVIEENQGRPPKIHDLDIVAAKAGLTGNLFQEVPDLTVYYIPARYPEKRAELAAKTDEEVAKRLLRIAKEVLEWAKAGLT